MTMATIFSVAFVVSQNSCTAVVLWGGVGIRSL